MKNWTWRFVCGVMHMTILRRSLPGQTQYFRIGLQNLTWSLPKRTQYHWCGLQNLAQYYGYSIFSSTQHTVSFSKLSQSIRLCCPCVACSWGTEAWTSSASSVTVSVMQWYSGAACAAPVVWSLHYCCLGCTLKRAKLKNIFSRHKTKLIGFEN